MKNLFYKTKKSIYQITKNDDGTVTFYPKEMNAGCIIQNRGGVTEFLKFCIDDKLGSLERIWTGRKVY